MGALRAAEMDTLGMVGIGEVTGCIKPGNSYQMTRWRLSSIRSGILSLGAARQYPFYPRKARECGVISGMEHDALLAAARSVFYPHRTYARIAAAAAGTAGTGTQERFLAWVGENACDRKRLDAIEALEYIAGLE